MDYVCHKLGFQGLDMHKCILGNFKGMLSGKHSLQLDFRKDLHCILHTKTALNSMMGVLFEGFTKYTLAIFWRHKVRFEDSPKIHLQRL